MTEEKMSEDPTSSSTTTIPFPLPIVSTTPKTWGPPSNSNSTTKFNLLPYAPFGRSDRLGRSADFTSSGTSYDSQGQAQGYGAGGRSSAAAYHQHQHNKRTDRRFQSQTDAGQNADFQYKVTDDDFELVDNSSSRSLSVAAGGGGGSGSIRFSAAQKRQKQNRLRQLNSYRNSRGDDDGGRGGRGGGGYQQFQKTRGGQFGGRGGGRMGGRMGGRGRGRGRGGRGYRERIDRQPSVSVKTTWTMVHEMDLNKISKNVTNTALPSKQEDLFWCGFLDRYNDAYDKCSVKSPATLKRSENKEFYPVTTTDDPVIEKVRRCWKKFNVFKVLKVKKE